MKRLVKKIIGRLFVPKWYPYVKFRNRDLSVIEAIFNCKAVKPIKDLPRSVEYTNQFSYMCSHIKWAHDSFYIYPYDPTLVRMTRSDVQGIASITVDFAKVLDSNLDSLLKEAKTVNDTFGKVEETCILAITKLANRIADCPLKDNRQSILKGYFQSLCYKKPTSLDEALQKLLFYNALFWQAGHCHIGLGRLDMVLLPYYERDIKSGKIGRDDAKKMIAEFCRILGKQTINKSMSLIGDTGQYILLGGCDKNGNTIQNDLTEIFLKVFTEQHFPDPKLILRVNKDTSIKIWQAAIKCIATGSGSPLLMNETPIMASMLQFGYKKEDIWNVGTSACWEPLIIGKSFDQNNPLPSINLISALNETISEAADNTTFDQMMSSFYEHVRKETLATARDITFDCSPLFTLFMDDCLSRRKDFSEGGAEYAYHGMQAVGLPNAVNGLLNIKKIVFEDKLFSMYEIQAALSSNFNQADDLRALMLSNPKKFGKNDDDVLKLTNDIMDYVGAVISTITINGTKVKVGFSSPNYINCSHQLGASADGRKAKEPLAVHISPISSDIDIAEIMDFATQLNYSGNRINGNVVDFIVPSSYVNNQDKLLSILRNACDFGVFELQLNVFDVAMLKDAKAHPEKYPNLIVRVWGFSAYFNDLPEEYKDNLISRAEAYA